MSKVGKKPIEIPQGVTVTKTEGELSIKKDKFELRVKISPTVHIEIKDKEVTCTTESTNKFARSIWGTTRSLIANAITGVTSGYEKTLILEGVGYKITKEGNNLALALGYSHPIKFIAPEGITFEVEKNSILKIKGIDKILVGQVAANIRKLRKPEPYKGKGFRYNTEVIRRKAGKKTAGTTA